MNKLDKDYQELLKDILSNGNKKSDRTGTGTISVFGREIRHNMKDGFPLLTTKKMFTTGVIEELIWFMKGDTNIQTLLSKGVNIWNGDAYKKYQNVVKFSSNPHDRHIISEKSNGILGEYVIGADFTYDEFIEKIKTDDKFAERWGELGRVYGKQWRDWRGYGKVSSKELAEKHPAYKDILSNIMVKRKSYDQFLDLIHDLKYNPDSRRLMVSSWKVDELENMTLPPCHYHFQCYTRELTLKERVNLYVHEHQDWVCIQEHKFFDRHNIPKRELSLKWNQRSVDTFLGLPFNIASYGFLLLFLAKITNMTAGELIGSFGDTHIYSNHTDAVETQLLREGVGLPTFEYGERFTLVDKHWKEDKFMLDGFLSELTKGDFIINNYNPHPAIKAPLSN